MFWMLLWLFLILLHALIAWGLWRLTGYLHPEDSGMRRLCFICWVLALIYVDAGVVNSEPLVHALAGLVAGG